MSGPTPLELNNALVRLRADAEGIFKMFSLPNTWNCKARKDKSTTDKALQVAKQHEAFCQHPNPQFAARMDQLAGAFTYLSQTMEGFIYGSDNISKVMWIVMQIKLLMGRGLSPLVNRTQEMERDLAASFSATAALIGEDAQGTPTTPDPFKTISQRVSYFKTFGWNFFNKIKTPPPAPPANAAAAAAAAAPAAADPLDDLAPLPDSTADQAPNAKK